MRQLKAGMTVTIYTDPLTRRKPEGKAKLIHPSESPMGRYEGRWIEYWWVKFIFDGKESGLFSRRILGGCKEEICLEECALPFAGGTSGKCFRC